MFFYLLERLGGDVLFLRVPLSEFPPPEVLWKASLGWKINPSVQIKILNLEKTLKAFSFWLQRNLEGLKPGKLSLKIKETEETVTLDRV